MRPPQIRRLMLPQLQITTCAHREITCGTVASMERFRIKTKLMYMWFPYSGDALIGRSRSFACTQFMEREWTPDYMLFIDDDILFRPEDVENIYDDLAKGYEIVGGCYPVKDASQLASLPWEDQFIYDGTVKSVEYVATGFMGVSKSALRKIKDGVPLKIVNPNDWARCYPFFESYGYYGRNGDGRKRTSQDPIYLSEDWDFCEKARKVGLECYLDTKVLVEHQGLRVATVSEVEVNQARKMQEETSGR